MAYNEGEVLELVKVRLNKLGKPLPIDRTLQMRIAEAAQELEDGGIHLREDARDTMLIVDLAVWNYQNRDKPGDMPRWLTRKINRRWIKDDA